eukprot:m.355480 g.355480  ORF g.355480 m.355480 type:complete len:156 (-) comp19924_c1_seq2:74-541(-)
MKAACSVINQQLRGREPSGQVGKVDPAQFPLGVEHEVEGAVGDAGGGDENVALNGFALLLLRQKLVAQFGKVAEAVPWFNDSYISLELPLCACITARDTQLSRQAIFREVSRVAQGSYVTQVQSSGFKEKSKNVTNGGSLAAGRVTLFPDSAPAC